MSSYLDIYFKDKTGGYIQIGSYIRSNEMYKRFDNYFREYSTLVPINIGDIQDMIDAERADRDYYERRIRQIKEKSQVILSLKDHTIQEKMEAVDENEETLCELDEIIEEIDATITELSFIQTMIMLNKGDEEATTVQLVYAGIDCTPPQN